MRKRAGARPIAQEGQCTVSVADNTAQHAHNPSVSPCHSRLAPQSHPSRQETPRKWRFRPIVDPTDNTMGGTKFTASTNLIHGRQISDTSTQYFLCSGGHTHRRRRMDGIPRQPAAPVSLGNYKPEGGTYVSIEVGQWSLTVEKDTRVVSGTTRGVSGYLLNRGR